MNDHPKTISVFFYLRVPEFVGNVVMLHTLSYIVKHYNTVIYSNYSAFLKQQFPQFNTISLDHIQAKSNRFPDKLTYWRKIARVLNADQSDAVYLGHESAPVALWLKKDCFQYIYQVHEMLGFGMERKPFYKRINQKILELYILKGIRKSRANFVVSEPMMEYLQLHNITRLYLTPHCVDLKRFSEPCFTEFHDEIRKKREQGYFIICYSGWVSEGRGLNLMLESLRMSIEKDPDILFLIAGSDDEYTRQITSYFSERCLQDNLMCLGKIAYAHIPGIIALSDVCLSFLEDNPVYRMSPPQKVIEYLASGKPVIANDMQTHALLVTNEYDGFLTVDNPIEIADKILFLKSNPVICHQMGENARNTSAKYDTDLVYGKMKEAIDQMLNKK
jgi:glycosyltransferase involved in cell wall biosynthesis